MNDPRARMGLVAEAILVGMGYLVGGPILALVLAWGAILANSSILTLVRMHHGFDERGLPLRDYQEGVSRIWLSAAGQCALVSAFGIWIAVLKGAFDVIRWTRPREGVALLGFVSALLGLALLTKRRPVRLWCFLFALGALVAVLAWRG